MMLSPTKQTKEMWSQDSFHESSQHAVGIVVEDTATSAPRSGEMLGSLMAISSRAPDSAFARDCVLSHSCSVSPEL